MTILGQLPFMLFTEIAQTWVVQRDSVNTVIIHSYSTEGSLKQREDKVKGKAEAKIRQSQRGRSNEQWLTCELKNETHD